MTHSTQHIIINFQLFTLGLDSQFGTLQGVIQAATDLKLFPENMRKEVQTGLVKKTAVLKDL